MNVTRNLKKNNHIALVGALGGLTVLLSITRLGYIPWFSGAAITILHIPVLIAIFFGSFLAGLSVSFIFGISSLVMAVVMPSGPLDPYFLNPIISIVPRLIFAIITFFLFDWLRFLLHKFNLSLEAGATAVAIAISAFLGTLIHSVLVLGMLLLFKAITKEIFFAVLVANAFLEAIASVVISLAIFSGLYGSRKKNKKAKLLSDQDELTK